jgi:predicted RNA-binding protein (virulence factor B family)
MLRLGRMNKATVVREAPQGLYLDDGPESDGILLPTRWVTGGMGVGSRVEVFVFKDAEGRPIATTDVPRAAVGELAALEVTSLHERAGAFLDWGLSKDLLLPFGEMARREDVAVGDRVIVAVTIDGSNRISATQRLDPHFATTRLQIKANEPVDALVYGESPLGYKCIVNRTHAGLLYRSETTDVLKVGDERIVYVKTAHEDGKVDLRRDPAGYGRVEALAEAILFQLRGSGGKLAVNDKSPPDVIRQRFDCSKKAFKQAVGSLYKQRRVRLTAEGMEWVGDGERES